MFFTKPPRVLAIGAHPDDVELGAGGFIAKLIKQHGAHVELLVLTHGVQHRDPRTPYNQSNRERETINAASVLGIPVDNVFIRGFADCGLHAAGHELIRTIEAHLSRPGGFDIVLTHAGADTHSDHRETHEATVSASRYFVGMLLLYAAPSTKPNGFHPTFFASLDRDLMEQKDLALRAHASQRDKHFMKQSRTFGIASSWIQFHRVDLEYLEAFEVYKSFW